MKKHLMVNQNHETTAIKKHQRMTCYIPNYAAPNNLGAARGINSSAGSKTQLTIYRINDEVNEKDIFVRLNEDHNTVKDRNTNII